MVLELSGCEGNGVKVSFFVQLGQYGPRPPGVSAVPVAASVIKVYWRSDFGKAITILEVSCFCRMKKAFKAFSGSGPDL